MMGHVGPFTGGRWLSWGGVGASVLGFALFGWVATKGPGGAMASYLAAWVGAMGIAVGALVWLAITHTIRAVWPTLLRNIAESLALMLLPLSVLFVPIALSLEMIYPWTGPALASWSVHEIEAVVHKGAYLQREFFLVRSAVYLVTWSTLAFAFFALVKAKKPDSTQGLRTAANRDRIVQRLAAASLPFLGITVTFAAFDWQMSMTPTWFSTAFGVYWFASAFSAGIAVLVLMGLSLAATTWLRDLLNSSHLYALGRLQFALATFWAYIAFFQFFLIWIGNKPEEVHWYLHRSEHGWQWLAWVIAVGRFVAPFALLLPRANKSNTWVLGIVAALIAFCHALESYWIIAPAELPEGAHAGVWAFLAALLGIVGISLATAIWALRGRPIVPIHDPNFEEALAYASR